MMNFKNKTVFITGASSGIGEACAQEFAAIGARLILAARRKDKLEKIASELNQRYETESCVLVLDVRDKEQVARELNHLLADGQNIDVLINNAGLALSTDVLQEGDVDNWDTMIDTNIKGLLYVTRQVLPGMVARNSGHIINIGSIAGEECYPGGNVYSATKHAVRAISKSLRLDLLGTAIRVTEIAPGAVETEFSIVRFKEVKRAHAFYKDFVSLVAKDIADAAVYCATRPQHVDIAEMTIMPTAQASANHLYRSDKD
ncbi:SDR family NAD(P)-dependent oxidoreductase [Legionella israelensis]|uniref:SDR family NAD(P)-dependent oxidoreductase n=2 Tax=Legionella israelensis TaxID=454 RepID=A0AAX1EJC2_9GAMM|nr:SDR family NAD(P)-dependent oxidoreductase [Legionella israelensis]